MVSGIVVASTGGACWFGCAVEVVVAIAEAGGALGACVNANVGGCT